MKIFLIILGIFLLLGLVGFLFASMGLGEIKRMVVKNVDLSKVADGVYTGQFHKVRWNYEVEVEVKDHAITSIRLLNKMPDPSSEKIADGVLQRIIEKQTLDIDVVSGASVNTKAVRKAVEDALIKGEKE